MYSALDNTGVDMHILHPLVSHRTTHAGNCHNLVHPILAFLLRKTASLDQCLYLHPPH